MSSITSEKIFAELNQIEIIPLNNQEKAEFFKQQIRALSDILIQQYATKADIYETLPDYCIFLLTHTLVHKANFYSLA
jgi:hypothetical protein